MEASYSITHKESEYRILLTPVRLDNYDDGGNGYSIFMHLIARYQHADVVEMLKDSIMDVSGK